MTKEDWDKFKLLDGMRNNLAGLSISLGSSLAPDIKDLEWIVKQREIEIKEQKAMIRKQRFFLILLSISLLSVSISGLFQIGAIK